VEFATRYASSGDINVACHVVGRASVDLVFVPTFISKIELSSEQPTLARLLGALARFTRLIAFDRRGCVACDRRAGPGEAAAALALAGETDLREVLPSVQRATLVPRRAPAPSERVLATVLFTDIVGSTELVGELGDAGWRALLERHDALLALEVARHRGRVVKSLGDGALALFDGPSRAIGCALAIRAGLAELGLQGRAGLHTGECELLAGEDVGGIAVHIAARIAALADRDEVLASGTVRELSVGSPFRLDSRGEHQLKGVAEPWRVFAVQDRAQHHRL